MSYDRWSVEPDPSQGPSCRRCGRTMKARLEHARLRWFCEPCEDDYNDWLHERQSREEEAP